MKAEPKISFKNQENRQETNRKIIQFEDAIEKYGSQRKAEKFTEISRTTYQHWRNRQQKCDLNNVLIQFFQQPEGLSFLHRIALAAEFVITQLCGCGLGIVQKFYELSHIDRLVSCSSGSLHKRISTMETNLGNFGSQQQEKLSEHMPTKSVTCALDETFPSGICLVGIEVKSNFILLEKFAEKRDYDTWKNAMEAPLSALPIKVIQVVSDEARALVKYANTGLEANHSPDVFHVQQDVIKATTAPLKSRIKTAKTVLEQANNNLQAWIDAKAGYEQLSPKPIGRPVQYDQQITYAILDQKRAIENMMSAVSRRDEVKEANRGIGNDYHPFDLGTGEKITSEILEEKLNHHFSVIEQHAEQAELSENSVKKIHKARRVVDSMLLTLQFFWSWVTTEIGSLNLSDDMEKIFVELLLPLAYLEECMPKAKNAKLKHKHRALYKKLWVRLNKSDAWQSTSDKEKVRLQSHAKECSEVFQRSSSCVEGRNGQISFRHHASRKMSPRKLTASTVIHNYFIRRPDGTTAAQRLFEQEHEDVFEWLLEHTDYPSLPAEKRATFCKLRAVA